MQARNYYYLPGARNKKLIFRSNSIKENDRSRKEFLRIREKLLKGIKLNIEEGEFFYSGIRSSLILEDGKITDYDECNDYHFRFTYLCYHHDLSGGGQYENVKNGLTYLRDRREIQMDLEFLDKCLIKWKYDLSNIDPSDLVLVFINQELNIHIKKLKMKPEFNEYGFFRKSQKYLYSEKQLYFRAKWLKMSADKFFYYVDKDNLSINVNGETILFNERSYVHITYWHYAPLFNEFETNKTYHGEEIHHFQIHFHALKIAKKIFESGIKPEINKEYDFQYKTKLYSMYLIKESNNFVISSFFPKSIEGTNNYYTKKPIDSELILLTKK